MVKAVPETRSARKGPQRDAGKRRLRTQLLTLVIICAATLTVACSDRDGQDGRAGLATSSDGAIRHGLAAMPEYRVGDSFSYDNGRKETVVAVDGDLVSWQSDSGFSYTAFRNPIMPRLAWETRTRKSKLEDLTALPDDLWPLKVGNKAFFSYRNTVVEKESGLEKDYALTFDCRVEGVEKVSVPAGTFDTYRISCHRNKRSTGRYFGVRNWYYAPAIGHYVLREDFYRSKYRPPRRVALTSLMPSLDGFSADGRRALESVLQNALETLASGTIEAWSSPDGAYGGTVMPLRTFKTTRGLFCRDYLVTVTAADRTGRYQRTACRLKPGAWQTI